jgi:hypothetical protein
MASEAEFPFQTLMMPRVLRAMEVLSAAGALAGWSWLGWRWGLAFLLGAAAAYLNFLWLHRAVESLVPGAPPAKKRVFVFLAIRYVLLGAAGYVIVKVFGMSIIAAAGGLLIPAAAILSIIIYELIHGT